MTKYNDALTPFFIEMKDSSKKYGLNNMHNKY